MAAEMPQPTTAKVSGGWVVIAIPSSDALQEREIGRFDAFGREVLFSIAASGLRQLIAPLGIGGERPKGFHQW